MAGASEALLIAFQHHQAGRRQAAEQICRQVLAVAPRQPDALHLLGLLALEIGQHELAIGHIRDAIRVRGAECTFHNSLGEAYRRSGRIAEAEACFRRAVKLKRNFPEAHHNLGIVLREQKKLDQAIASFRQALKLKPRYADAHNNLGVVFSEQGKVERAITSYRRALDENPNCLNAQTNLAIALESQGRLDAALAGFRRVVELNPDFAEGHSNLGNLFWEQGKRAEAANCFRRATQLKPDLAEGQNNLGNALRDQGEYDEAANCCRRAIQINPDFADAHSNLGNALVHLGQFAESEAAFRFALRLQPKLPGAHSGLAMLLGGRLPPADLAALEQRLSAGQLNDRQRAELLFALAHALDGHGEYLRAAEYLTLANALRLRLAPARYDPAAQDQFVSGLTRAFGESFFARVAGLQIDAPEPVFVFGLPRSGTTLIEQILASHPRVHGAGELLLGRQSFEAIPTVLGRDAAPLDCASHLDAVSLRSVAERHLAGLRAVDKRGSLRIVDKMPDNYLFFGLLAGMFPQATFIHCRRDPRDVAISCWLTDFRDAMWVNDIEHIATRFEQYYRIMEHSRAVLPAPIHEVDYEQTVDDLPSVAQRLVAACGLDWDPACLEFHRAQRPIHTASVVQVRRPVYGTSVGRWRNYEQPLADLLARLPSNPAR